VNSVDVTTSQSNPCEGGFIRVTKKKRGDIRALKLVKITKLGRKFKTPKRSAKFIIPSFFSRRVVSRFCPEVPACGVENSPKTLKTLFDYLYQTQIQN